MFTQQRDMFGAPYFSVDLSDPALPRLHLPPPARDATFFSQRNLPVSPRAAGPFSSDLTSRDDVLLALLSLLLLLALEGVVSTLLLRTRRGAVSPSGAALTHLLDAARDFDLRRLLPPRRTPRPNPPSRLLSAAAVLLLLATLGLEILILFITAPRLVPVTNATASLRLRAPALPVWLHLRFHLRAAMDKPCEALSFVGVVQQRTSVTACVVSDAVTRENKHFVPSDAHVIFQIVSDVHDYGAEHFVQVANLSAHFSTRARFHLQDTQPRLMAQLPRPADEAALTQVVHLQFLAYLFSAHRFVLRSDVNESRARLEGVETEFTVKTGPPVVVLGVQRASRRYVLRGHGVLPQGTMVLRFAHHFFRGAAEVVVAGGNATDLFVGGGVRRREAAVWFEEARAVNWLALVIMLAVTLVTLVGLRVVLKPAATADVAEGIFELAAVRGDVLQLPTGLVGAGWGGKGREGSGGGVSGAGVGAGGEKREVAEERSYRMGAETNDEWDWTDCEYDESDE